jgi:hypothetical protein
MYSPEQETAIAYWTRPQYCDVSGKVKIGVAAYALEGIKKVEFFVDSTEGQPLTLDGDFTLDGKVDGEDLNYILSNWELTGPKDLLAVLGNWGRTTNTDNSIGVATEEALNDQTGELEWWFEFDSTQYSDGGKVRISAKVTPTIGEPLWLEGDFRDDKAICGLDIFPIQHNTDIFYVSSEHGSDETGEGTEENPFSSIQYALWHDSPDNIGGRVIRLLDGSAEFPSNASDRTLRNSNSSAKDDGRWVTIESAVDPVLCPITKRHGGNWDCKIHLKNINVVPTTEEEQDSLLSGSTARSAFWFDGCNIFGVTRRGGVHINRSGPAIFSTGTLWDTHFQLGMRVLDIQSTYNYITADINLTNYTHLVSNMTVSNHGRAKEIGSIVHSDLIQTHTGGNYEGVLFQHNIIYRNITEWDNHGGQMFFGGYGRNENPKSIFKNMAVIGCKLAHWAGLQEDDETGKSRLFAWGPKNTRNVLFQDNLFFGKGNWFGSMDPDSRTMENYSGEPHYKNVRWSRNYRTEEKKEFFMPSPDAPVASAYAKSTDFPYEYRFDPETMSFPWDSPMTGVRYDGDYESFSSHKRGDYTPNDDYLP